MLLYKKLLLMTFGTTLVYLLSKYLKCSVWRLAVRYDIYIYIYVVRRQRVNIQKQILSVTDFSAKNEGVISIAS